MKTKWEKGGSEETPFKYDREKHGGGTRRGGRGKSDGGFMGYL